MLHMIEQTLEASVALVPQQTEIQIEKDAISLAGTPGVWKLSKVNQKERNGTTLMKRLC